jgi:hypothetical protein
MLRRCCQVVVVRVAGGAVGILVMGVMGAGAVDDAGASAADLVDVIVDADIPRAPPWIPTGFRRLCVQDRSQESAMQQPQSQ